VAFAPEAVETVIVDSKGTIVNVTAAADALEPHADDPAAVAGFWRDHSLTYAAMSHHLGPYEPFWTLVARALDYAVAAHDLGLSEADRADVLDQYCRLDAFEDAAPGSTGSPRPGTRSPGSPTGARGC
jgi:2-haloacid dehalogenase